MIPQVCTSAARAVKSGAVATRAGPGSASPRISLMSTPSKSHKPRIARPATMRVLIPNPLRSYTANAAAVDALGKTLGDLTRDLDRHYPRMRFRIVDEQGQIRPHIKFFVNVAPARSLAKPLADAAEGRLVCALSG